jgi:K(+)-stimulated pyrophosphate-energized sodium pump
MFAIGSRWSAAVLRIAGGIFTKIADIGSDLMKVVFKIKEDDARNPGVIADCRSDNAGDSWDRRQTASRPTASPAWRVITFILLAVPDQAVRSCWSGSS